jgi:Domain of unknown function (DUF4386)
MERSSREWLWPLTGIVFIVLLFVSFIVQGDPKDATHPPNEIAQWYSDNKDSAEIGAFLGTVAALLLVFFGAYLKRVLEAAGGTVLPILVLIGTVIVALAAAIDNMFIFVAAERVDDIPASGIQTIQAIYDNDFLPFILGIMVFLWSAGLSVLTTGGLPRWMGWLAIVFAVVSLAGPVSFFAVPGAGIWVLLASIILTMQARRPAAPQPVTA